MSTNSGDTLTYNIGAREVTSWTARCQAARAGSGSQASGDKTTLALEAAALYFHAKGAAEHSRSMADAAREHAALLAERDALREALDEVLYGTPTTPKD